LPGFAEQSFLVMNEGGKPRFYVSEGKIAVQINPPKEEAEEGKEPTKIDEKETAKEIIITTGETAVIKTVKVKKGAPPIIPTITKRTMNKSENLHMDQYAIAKYDKKAAEKTVEELKKQIKVIEKKEVTFSKKNEFTMIAWDEEKLSPTERLKKKKKQISKLYLIGGEIIVGHIFWQDETTLKLNTGDAKITIPKSEIKKREAVK